MKTTFFTPGKLIKTFTTKSGKKAELIYPKWEMLHQLLDYINTLSKENTFIRFSGEEISLENEANYLASIFASIELRRAVFVHCVVDGQLVGVCEVGKLPDLRERGKHVARFGITVAKDFRGEGIGYELANTTIEEAKESFEGLKLIVLECFASNTNAIKLYKKLGFQEVGKLPEYTLHKGEYIDEVMMTLKV